MNTWVYLSGSQSIDMRPDYAISNPGGIRSHSMAIDDQYLYVFGGFGYDSSSSIEGISVF